jgi:hypothetical protein
MQKVNFKPSPGLILVAPIAIKAKETRGKSNILLPGTSIGKADDFASVDEIFDEWPFQARVVAVGNALPNIPIDVEIGDIVYLARELTVRDAVLVDKVTYATIRVSDTHGKIIKE